MMNYSSYRSVELIDQFVHQMVMLPKLFFRFPCVVGVTKIQPFHFVFDL